MVCTPYGVHAYYWIDLPREQTICEIDLVKKNHTEHMYFSLSCEIAKIIVLKKKFQEKCFKSENFIGCEIEKGKGS